MSTSSSDRSPAGAPGPAPQHATQEISIAPPAGSPAAAPVVSPPPPRPVTGGHDLPPPRAAQPPTSQPPTSQPQTAHLPAAPVQTAVAPRPAEVRATGPVDVVPGPPVTGGPASAPAPTDGRADSPGPAATDTGATGPAANGPAASGTADAPAAEDSVPAGAAPPGPGAEHRSPAPAPSWPESLEEDPPPVRGTRLRALRSAGRQALVGPSPTVLAAVLAAVLAVVLLELGLLAGSGAGSFWSTVTLWSAFATASAVLATFGLVAACFPVHPRLRSEAGRRIAAAGLIGLSVFWVLVVLPVVASDRGFLLTAALGCLGAALWIGPARRG